jgi:L,D-peptidoglycan transpeptidase YkuD (ErfK/YbiS/YcfS/YnhG family)
MRPVGMRWRRGTWKTINAHLPGREISSRDGWCDCPADPNYNRPVTLPYPASHERMLRNDHLYDCVVILDWNFRPRKRGAGSAIFLHIAKPGLEPTEGCIAVAPEVMRRILPLISRSTIIRVVR